MLLIDLLEYGTWAGVLRESELDGLMSIAGDRLVITRRPGGATQIAATAHVGVIVTPTVSVRVRPKVELDSLFHLLGVGDELWRIDPSVASYAADDEDLSTSVVRLLCREVERVSSHGLLHGYVVEQERLLAVRGRVDLSALARRPWERSPISCTYDEFVPDIFVNRVLLAAMVTARQVPGLPAAVRGELHQLIGRFDGVAQVPIRAEDVDRWKPARQDRRYEVAMSLASIVLRRVDLADRDGRGRAASFTIDMNKLFEEFVGRELARRMPPRLELAEQYSSKLDRAGRLSMRPDFVIHPAGRQRDPLAVADTKYKLTEALGVISDHYQLLSYATVFGLKEGTLIYCQRPDGAVLGEDDVPVRSVDIVGSEVCNYVYRLDLSGTRLDIAVRMDRLAGFLEDRINAAATGADWHNPLVTTALQP